MGTFELINMLGSTALVIITTLWANGQKTQRVQFEREVERTKLADATQADARKLGGEDSWLDEAQVIAALFIIFIMFTLPLLLPTIRPDVSVTIGYYSTERGLFPWQQSVDAVHWLTVGSGERPLVIPPWMSNITITVGGLLFGRVVAKR